MKSKLKNRLAAAALCFAALSAMETPASDGFHRPNGFNQACRLLSDKKRLEATKTYSLFVPFDAYRSRQSL
jgi:hypothetical protein